MRTSAIAKQMHPTIIPISLGLIELLSVVYPSLLDAPTGPVEEL